VKHLANDEVVSLSLVEAIARRAHLDDLEVEDHRDSLPDLTLETVDLKAHALEDELGTGVVGDPLERGLDLGRVDCRRRDEDVERDGQEPDRRDVELAGLKKGVRNRRSERDQATEGG
jgi:hypothetical protein